MKPQNDKDIVEALLLWAQKAGKEADIRGATDNGARRTEATFLQDYLLPRMHDIFEHDGVSDIWRHQLEMCSPSQRDLEEMVER